MIKDGKKIMIGHRKKKNSIILFLSNFSLSNLNKYTIFLFIYKIFFAFLTIKFLKSNI